MANISKSQVSEGRPDGVRVTAVKCVRCKAPVTPRFRPFCSKRCSDIDLAGWLTGQYRIPTEEQVETGDLSAALDED